MTTEDLTSVNTAGHLCFHVYILYVICYLSLKPQLHAGGNGIALNKLSLY